MKRTTRSRRKTVTSAIRTANSPRRHPAHYFRPAALALAMAAAGSAWANPLAPTVVHGNATFTADGSTLTVQNSPGTIINWQQFSIGADETTRFLQGGAASSVLNRVTGGDASSILGRLQSNGQVWLINPNGIAIAGGAHIDTAGFLASSLQMTDADFLVGRQRFSGTGSEGGVSNAGLVEALGGNIFLLAPTVENSGVLRAADGNVVLAAGHSVTLVDAASPYVGVEVSAPPEQTLDLGALAQSGVFGSIRNRGAVEASAVVRDAGGRILLVAAQDVTQEAGGTLAADGKSGGNIDVRAQAGTAWLEGEIRARGDTGGGGHIAVTGERVGVAGDAQLDASGSAGGGTLRIGGGWQGADTTLANAERTFIAAGARLRADATAAGDGGDIVVWADDSTRFLGSISARGAGAGGNGGAVEVSGKQMLQFAGSVDVGAEAGTGGSLLLDPASILLINGTQPPIPNNTAGTPDVAFIDIAGSVVDIGTVTGFDELYLQATGDITLNGIMTMGAGNRLVLEAGNDIILNGDLTVTGSTVLTADADNDSLGSIALNSGTTTLAGATFNGAFNYNGGNLVLNGIAVANDGFNWNGTGTLVGSGTLQLPVGTAFNVSGAGDRVLSGLTLDSAGLVNLSMSGGSFALQVNDGALLDSTGELRFSNDLGGGGDDRLTTTSGSGSITGGGLIRTTEFASAQIATSVLDLTNAQLLTPAGTLHIAAGNSNFAGTLSLGGNVLLEGNTTLADGTFVSGTLNQQGGLMMLAGNATLLSVYNFNGGDLAIAGTARARGGFNWGGTGTISGPGTLEVRASLNAYGSGNRAFSGVTVQNSGVINISMAGGGYQLQLNDGAVLNNDGDILFSNDFAGGGDDSIVTTSGFGTLSNTGTIESSGGTVALLAPTQFNVVDGRLLTPSGSLQVAAATATYAGLLDFGSVTLQGDSTFADGTTVNGPLIQNAGTLSLPGLVTVNDTFHYNGGSLVIDGTAVANNGFNWAGGTSISGAGSLYIASGTSMNLVTTGNRVLSGTTLFNDGLLNLSILGGVNALEVNDGAVVHNNGEIRFSNDFGGAGDDSIITTSGIGTINSLGLITTTDANTATLAVSQLSIGGGQLLTPAGTLRLANANTSYSGALTLDSGVMIEGDGFAVDGAVITGPVNLQAGTLTVGTVTFNNLFDYAGGSLVINGTATANGGFDWGVNAGIGGFGTLAIAGGSFNLFGGGNRVLNGLTVNNGSILNLSLADAGAALQLDDGSVLNNGGEIRFSNDFGGAGDDLILTASGTGTLNSFFGLIQATDVNTAGLAVTTANITGGTLRANAGALHLGNAQTFYGNTVFLEGGVELGDGLHTAQTGATLSGTSTLLVGGLVDFTLQGSQVNIPLVYAGGQLHVTGPSTLAGGFDWQAPLPIDGGGTLMLPSGNVTNLAQSGDYLLSGITLHNSGVIDLSMPGGVFNLLLNDGAVLNNNGEIRFSDNFGGGGDDGILTASGTGMLANNGILRTLEPATVTLAPTFFSMSNGQMLNAAGAFQVNSSASYSGTINLASVDLNGDSTFANGTQVNGVVNQNAGTLTLQGSATFNDVFNFNGGNLVVFGPATANAGFNWAGGTMISGPGSLAIPVGQALNVFNGGNRAVSGATLNNAGLLDISMTGGSFALQLNDGAILNNSGELRFSDAFAGGGDDAITTASGFGTLNNTGQIRSSAAGAATLAPSQLNVAGGQLLSPAGTLLVNAGGTAFSGGVTLDSNVLLQGGASFTDGTVVAGPVNQNSGTLGVGNVVFNGLFNYNGGSLLLSGTSTYNGGFDWTSTSSIGGFGTLHIPAAASFNLVNAGDRTLSGVSVDNAGLLNISLAAGAFALNVDNGAVIDNAGEIRFSDDFGGGGDDRIATSSGSGTVDSTGLVNTTGAGTATLASTQVNINGGTLQASSGSLTVSPAGLLLENSTSIGSVTLQPDSLTFGSGSTNSLSGSALCGISSVTNLGVLNLNGVTMCSAVSNFGTVNLTGSNTFTGSAFHLQGGTLSVGSGATFVQDGGQFNWNGGVLAGTGSLSLANGATMNLSGSGSRVLDGLSLGLGNFAVNGGSLEVRSGTLAVSATASVMPGATLTHTGGTLGIDGALNVGGTFVHDAGVTTALQGTLANTGTLSVQSGTLSLAGGYSQSAGTVVIASGATLLLPTGTSASWVGGNLVSGAGSTLMLDGATLALTSSLTNNGLLQLQQGATLMGSGSLVNNGSFHLFGSSGSTTPSVVGVSLVNAGDMEVRHAAGVDGSFTNSGTLVSRDATLTFASGFTNNGLIELASDGSGPTPSFTVLNGALINQGSLVTAGSSPRTQHLVAELANDGFVGAQAGDLVISGSAAAHTNSGSIDVGNANLFVLLDSGGSFTQTGGSLLVNDGRVFAVSGNALQVQGGIVGGNGTLAASVVNQGGIVAPGFSVGTLTISGDYVQGSSGLLLLDVEGVAPGQYDQLLVGGDVQLGGFLDIFPSSSYQPAENDTWSGMVTAGGAIAGAFDDVSSGFQVIPGPSTLTVSHLPLPVADTYVVAVDVQEADLTLAFLASTDDHNGQALVLADADESGEAQADAERDDEEEEEKERAAISTATCDGGVQP